MKVELVTKSVGVGPYEGMSAGEIIEVVARHGKIKDYGKLILYLTREKHWSPLEHVHFTFKVETSRAISAQIFRHKSLHFQELSQRYDVIDEIEEIEIRRQSEKNRQSSTEIFNPMIVSDDKENTGFANRVIQNTIKRTLSVYKDLVNSGVARECARMILPMGSKTTIHITGNVRDLLAFLNVRCDHHAQKEVRAIAMRMGEELEKEMPEVMKSLDWRSGMFM